MKKDQLGKTRGGSHLLAQLFFTYVLLLTMAINSYAELRSWSHKKGGKIDAELVKADKLNVTLQRHNGQQGVISIADLSSEDQKYIKHWFEPIQWCKKDNASEYRVGYGELLSEKNLNNLPVYLAEQQIASEYLFAHAPSCVSYKIPEGARSFNALGVKPSGDDNIRGTWTYVLKVDGNEVFRSEPLNTFLDNIVPISVNLPKGAQTIDLIVEDLGSNISDHSIWANPAFYRYEIDELETSITRSKNDAEVYCKLSAEKFRDRVELFSDNKVKASLKAIPEIYKNRKMTVRKNGEHKEPLKFEVREAGLVTIACHFGYVKIYEPKGWSGIERNIEVYYPDSEDQKSIALYWLLQKHYEVGTYELEVPDTSWPVNLVL